MNRRTFLQAASAGTAALVPAFREDGVPRILAAGEGAAGRSAESLAPDEDFWFQIQSAFDVDRSLINLNNGSVSPSPRVVEQALRRYQDFVNLAAVRNQGILEGQVEAIRGRLAANLITKTDPERVADGAGLHRSGHQTEGNRDRLR